MPNKNNNALRWYAENGTVYNTDPGLDLTVCFHRHNTGECMSLPSQEIAEKVAELLNEHYQN